MTAERNLIDAADAARAKHGLLSVAETAALAAQGVVLFDPFSTLVSPRVRLAAGVTLWPGVALLTEDDGEIVVGEGADIGAQGGFMLRAPAGWRLMIGAGARLSGGGAVSGRSTVGAGAQILGAIDVRDVTLAAGGDWRSGDPDARGGVLKGAGRAFGLNLGQGRVIRAFGLFDAAQETAQSVFHPPSPR